MTLNLEFMSKTFFLALSGIPTTLSLTFISLAVASPIAFFMAVSKINKSIIISRIISFYVSIIRGTPIVLQILIIYSILPSLINSAAEQLNLDFNVFDLNPIWYGYAVFIMNSIATLSEVFRSALLTVNRGQLEAAVSLGISAPRAYLRIIIPQALSVALPNICNVTINLLKGTSLAFLMTIKDVTALAKIEAGYGYNYLEAYLDIFIIYVIVCTVVQLLYLVAERIISNYKRLA